MSRVGTAFCAAAVASSALLAPPLHAQRDTDLDGAWRAQEYQLAEGAAHPLAGHIMFVDGEWNVLFYVLDDRGEPVRMSAEGGTFTRDGDDLVFTHLYYAAKGEAVDGLEASPFEMRVRDVGVEEPSRAVVEGRDMTLFFPSGNRMTFVRAPG